MPIQITGRPAPVMTDWASYTPTIVNFGTATANISFFWRRNGQDLEVRGTLTAGTVVAGVGSFTLPGSLALNTSLISINNNTAAAGMSVGRGISNGAANGHTPIVTAPATSSTLVYTGNVFSGTNALIPGNVSGGYASASICAFEWRVPISGWTSFS